MCALYYQAMQTSSPTAARRDASSPSAFDLHSALAGARALMAADTDLDDKVASRATSDGDTAVVSKAGADNSDNNNNNNNSNNNNSNNNNSNGDDDDDDDDEIVVQMKLAPTHAKPTTSLASTAVVARDEPPPPSSSSSSSSTALNDAVEVINNESTSVAARIEALRRGALLVGDARDATALRNAALGVALRFMDQSVDVVVASLDAVERVSERAPRRAERDDLDALLPLCGAATRDVAVHAEKLLAAALALDDAADATRRRAVIAALLDSLAMPTTTAATTTAAAKLMQRAVTQRLPPLVLDAALATRVAPLLAHASADVRKVNSMLLLLCFEFACACTNSRNARNVYENATKK